MKSFCTLVLALLYSFTSFSQKELNVWTFGIGAGLDFNSGSPVPIITAFNNENGSASICDTSGQLLFYTDGNIIYNQNHNPMPNGIGLLPQNGLGIVSPATQPAVIAGVPGEENKYFVFSLEDKSHGSQGRLYYSIVDMDLAGGLGDVVPGQEAVLLDAALSGKMTVVAGNNFDIWLMVHSSIHIGTPVHNQWKAYRITTSGIEPPVISELLGNPDVYRSEVIRFSPDRKRMVASCTGTIGGGNNWAGNLLLLFDFDPTTGKLSNQKILGNSLSYGTFNFGANYGTGGVCFSPDNSKLYVSMSTASGGRIIQYDHVNTDNMADILSSAQLIYIHPSFSSMFQWFASTEIRLGPDNKIYVGRGPLYGSAFNTLHVINNPNEAGSACNFTPDVITLAAGTINKVGLPNDVVRLRLIDTTYELVACFEDSTILSPGDSLDRNFRWENGDIARLRTITQSGTYLVRYQDDKYPHIWYMDTFQVTISSSQIPEVQTDTVCKGMFNTARAIAPDTVRFRYTWLDDAGNLLSSRESLTGDTLGGLLPNQAYALYLEAIGTDCDTMLYFTTSEYPSLELEVIPAYAIIKYGDSIRLHVSGAYLYAWEPSGSLDSPTSFSPVAAPTEPTTYTVLGIDENGCRDTAKVIIDIDYSMADFIPNAFTPNGDGLNDLFKVAGLKYQKLIAFRVFNRWGQMIFETQHPDVGWDGKHKGELCEMGTYYYLIIIAYPDTRLNTFKGDITLIR